MNEPAWGAELKKNVEDELRGVPERSALIEVGVVLLRPKVVVNRNLVGGEAE